MTKDDDITDQVKPKTGRSHTGDAFPSPSPELVWKLFKDSWPSLGLNWESGRPEWTHLLLEWFRKEGKGLHFGVYPDPEVQGHTEYLTDLVWCAETEIDFSWMPPGLVVSSGIVLALESEWQPTLSEIMSDFYKLVDVKARLKVLLCTPPESIVEDLPEHVSTVISANQLQTPEERYLVVAFRPDMILAWSFDSSGAFKELFSGPYPGNPSPKDGGGTGRG